MGKDPEWRRAPTRGQERRGCLAHYGCWVLPALGLVAKGLVALGSSPGCPRDEASDSPGAHCHLLVAHGVSDARADGPWQG